MEVISEIEKINPKELRDSLQVISSYIENLRWYELGLALQEFIQKPSLKGHRLFVFENLIQKHSFDLDAFHYADLILYTSDDIQDPDDTIKFLKEVSATKTFERKPEAEALIRLREVDVMTQKGDFESALKQLNEIEKRVTEHTRLEVRSSFHRTQSNLDKARGDFDAFYQHALLFLSTSRIEKDVVLAYDLCMAALFSNKVCSFGELAAHPILNSLEDGEYQWLRELILLLDKGEPKTISEFNEKFLPIINKSQQFSNYIGAIQTKLALSVFLQVIFSRPFENRTLTFDDVAKACSIKKDQVELLVLKALSAEIIKGNIDEVEEKIVVTWCKPKALAKERLQHLKDQIDGWIKIVHKQKLELDKKTQSYNG